MQEFGSRHDSRRGTHDGRHGVGRRLETRRREAVVWVQVQVRVRVSVSVRVRVRVVVHLR